MADSWGQAVLVGVTGQPHTAPEKLTVKYSNGSTVMLEGGSLREFWGEMLQAFMVSLQVQNVLKQQAAAQQAAAEAVQMPGISSEKLRENLNLFLQKKEQNEKNGDDNNEE